jgi:hypothetical protein
MADVDHLKNLNDTHGHETGDRCLRIFAQTLRYATRGDDVAARFGGEERDEAPSATSLLASPRSIGSSSRPRVPLLERAAREGTPGAANAGFPSVP